MTIVVVYKECRIEIEHDGKKGHYSIWSPSGYHIAEDGVDMSKNDLIKDCQYMVDQYLKNPGENI